MKKMFAVLLAMLMLLGLCACGNTDKPQETTAPIASDAPATEPSATEEGELDGGFDIGVVPVEPFVFTFNGVTLIPGTVYDAAALPEPTSVYQVPSCAIEGTDNVYNFNDAVEITAFNDGSQEIIYSIAIFDPNVCTDEGLYLGDDMARVIELYGEDYTENGTAMVYTKGNTELTIILQNGFVVDMEFKWTTE
jgi:hypothetical protein